MEPSKYDLLDELKNVCIRIPLLQALKDIPIYANTVREFCINNSGRKRKEPPTIHFIVESSDLISGQNLAEKYIDLGSLVVSVQINGVCIHNTFIDLGVAIDIMTLETKRQLNLPNIRPTPTILELVDHSKINPEGVLDDIVVALDSWEYPVDFLVLQPKNSPGGHPIILGRLWLDTANAFIDCKSRHMFITQGSVVK